MLVQCLPTWSHLYQGNSIMLIQFLLYCIVLPPLLRPEFAHSLGEVSSFTPNFPFPLRSATKSLLGKKLRPMVNLTKS